jgi:hypothetical protein
MIRWQEQYSPEERRVTRECLRIIAELPDGLLVQDDVLVIPEDAPEDLKDRMVRYEGYLRWAAGLPATHWLSGGPANLVLDKVDRGIVDTPGPNTIDNTLRTPLHRTGGKPSGIKGD